MSTVVCSYNMNPAGSPGATHVATMNPNLALYFLSIRDEATWYAFTIAGKGYQSHSACFCAFIDRQIGTAEA